MSTIVFPPTNIRGEWLHHSCEAIRNEDTGFTKVILRDASDETLIVDVQKPIIIHKDEDHREWAMVSGYDEDYREAQTVVAVSRALAMAWRFHMTIECPSDGEVYVIGKGFSE